jgi:hypothetical protein
MPAEYIKRNMKKELHTASAIHVTLGQKIIALISSNRVQLKVSKNEL